MEKERFRWQTVFRVSILKSGDRANDFLNLQGPVFCFEYVFEELLVVFMTMSATAEQAATMYFREEESGISCTIWVRSLLGKT